MNTKEIINFCWNNFPEIAEKYDYEIMEIKFVKEFGSEILQILVDGLYGPVNFDDCLEISKLAGKKLDEWNEISEPYFLEVSSIGIDRPFDKYRDFEKNLGKKVEVKFFEAFKGAKEVKAKLISHDKETVVLNIKGINHDFNKKDIAVIKLSLFN